MTINLKAKSQVLGFFSSLADPTRLDILLSMASGDKSVGEIHAFLGVERITVSAVSHQLKLLKDLEVVTCVRQRKERRYSLSDAFCWCILRDTFKQFNAPLIITCKKCSGRVEDAK